MSHDPQFEPLATQRNKRQKVDKSGRLAALDRLRKLKGKKNTYEVEELQNVYDEVNEDEYGQKVLDRQYDDWIVDDAGGSGYVEDGREIFDDDLDDESVKRASKLAKEEKKGPRKRKREEDNKGDGKITSLFSNMSKKKAEEKINNDDLLGEIMAELNSEKETHKQSRPLNKFKSTPKMTPKTKDRDDLVMAQLMKEVSKKPKIVTTVLDEIESESIYDRPDHTIIPKTLTSKTEVKIKEPSKEISTLSKKSQKPDQKFSNSNEVPTSLEMETETFNLDDFVEDDFSLADVSTHKETTNGTGTIQKLNKKATEENLDQYIGDISDIDFANSEMDTSCNQDTSSSVINVQSTLDRSEMWKEKDADKRNDDIFAKAWQEDFLQPTDDSTFIKSSKTDEKIQFPIVKNSAGDQVFRFFWWDAFEDPYKQPGVVYLLGKVFVDSLNDYVSCCVGVKNIPRRIFLLPREYVKKEGTKQDDESSREENNLTNVYTEFNEYARKLGIKDFRSRETTKNYAFEREGIPTTSEYLEVRYPATDPACDPDYSGPAIEAIFGTSVNPMELFLIERNIKGPCWLDIKGAVPVDNPFAWTKVQVFSTKMEFVTVTTDSTPQMLPPISMATINVQVSLDPKQQKNEIVIIGILLHNKFQLDKAPPKPPFNEHYCLVTHPKTTTWPIKGKDRLAKITKTKVIRCDTELELLEKFLEIFQRADPDIVVGYDCGFQFDVLMSKIFALKVKNWSCVGKLRRLVPPYFKGKMNLSQIFCGRPICDITTSAKELNLKVRSYDLVSLCVSVLHKKDYECKEIKPEDCPKFYATAEKLEALVQSSMMQASYIISIVVELNILPLYLQITKLAGNTLSRTLSAGRAERNEFLLLHAFHQRGYITPDKRLSNKKKEGEQAQGKKKPQYMGGLVLDPKKGFYDKLILLMDFNSLYPSIIQEFNLCFTTVPGAAYSEVDDLELPESSVEDGVVPTEIRKLVESRIEVKKLMKASNTSPELKVQYNIRQLALKLTANSMYGCLGATHCRFYAKGLAALVTMKGREILQNTKSLVEKANYEVIYGDTDSIMINTNILEFDQVFNIGKEIKKEVNKTYRKVELDIDGVFRYLLLLQKKKYAALTMSKTPNGQLQFVKEIKGLDIVRRDWCGLACDIGNQILDQLLSDQASESRLDKIFDILQQCSKNLREGQLPLSLLVITKQLSKNPNEYPNDKKLSHVLVALRLNESGGRKWKAGDTVPYIICEDDTDRTPLERAYHIEEFKKSDSLKVDINYYLLNQIHPVVLRICEPIEGIDDVLLAQNLGVGDQYKPRKTYNPTNQEDGEVPLCVQDNRYEKCTPFSFTCRNEKCRTVNSINTTITEFAGVPKPSLAMCSNPDCDMPPWKYSYSIQNKLQMDVRRLVTDYYYGEVECENPICSKVMRRVTLDTLRTLPKCYVCLDGNVHRLNRETDLYNQLSFYLHLFTLNQTHYKNLKPAPTREMIAVYDTIKEFVEKQIQCNAYSVIDLTKMFWPNIRESEIDALSELDDKITKSTVMVEDLIQEDEDVDEVCNFFFSDHYINMY
ncbi:unnamed protein product [Trichogramma brassicae]|uniref:DNA polymerase n=1 Tax=Trichogramma brassicae TaxID=86971 RepID=A0A6H5I4P9_9HYME|nr:unnamed protein product [Trichogramma brassicae]